MTCKDEVTMNEDIDALKAKYFDVREHTGVTHSYLGMPLDISELGMSSITMTMFIAEVLKDAKLGSMATSLQHRVPYSCTRRRPLQ